MAATRPKKGTKKKAAPKKSATKKPAPKAALPEGLKHALGIAANEVLVEGLDSIAEDAEGFLEGGDLGATYQSPFGPDTLPAADVERMLRDLSAWDPNDGSESWQRLSTAMFAAGMDFARALVCLATGAGEVPRAVAPYASSIAHVTKALKRALADGYFDDEDLGTLLG